MVCWLDERKGVGYQGFAVLFFKFQFSKKRKFELKPVVKIGAPQKIRENI